MKPKPKFTKSQLVHYGWGPSLGTILFWDYYEKAISEEFPETQGYQYAIKNKHSGVKTYHFESEIKAV